MGCFSAASDLRPSRLAGSALLLFICVRLAPESPRWLIFKQKEQEADDTIHFIAECNHIDVPEQIDFSSLHKDVEKVGEYVIARRNGNAYATLLSDQTLMNSTECTAPYVMCIVYMHVVVSVYTGIVKSCVFQRH